MVMTSSDESVPSDEQHTTPCHDCPWRRESLPGWLGGVSATEWVARAHGEALVPCHAYTGPQCAGLAIYRANVVKSPRDPSILRLPADRRAVFSSPFEFVEHHYFTGERNG